MVNQRAKTSLSCIAYSLDYNDDGKIQAGNIQSLCPYNISLRKTPIIEYDKYALFPKKSEKRIFISFHAFLPSLKHEWKTEETLLPRTSTWQNQFSLTNIFASYPRAELGSQTFTVQPHILTHINILVFLLVCKENCTPFLCVVFVYGRRPTVYMFCQPNTVANLITFLPKNFPLCSSLLYQQMEYAGTF